MSSNISGSKFIWFIMQNLVGFSEEFTKDHLGLLYVISKYSRFAKKEGESEQYIREFPLRTFIYEGILKEIFNYDYAPMSVEVLGGRRYLNISQDAEDDLADLRLNGLIECLKVTSQIYLPINAYRINEAGSGIIEKCRALKPDILEKIDNLVACPKCKGLLEVKTEIAQKGDEKAIIIKIYCKKCDFSYKSSFADIEDISYEIIPYFPKIPRVDLLDKETASFKEEKENGKYHP